MSWDGRIAEFPFKLEMKLQRFVFPTKGNEIKGKPQNEIDWMENNSNFLHLFCVRPEWEGDADKGREDDGI